MYNLKPAVYSVQHIMYGIEFTKYNAVYTVYVCTAAFSVIVHFTVYNNTDTACIVQHIVYSVNCLYLQYCKQYENHKTLSPATQPSKYHRNS